MSVFIFDLLKSGHPIIKLSLVVLSCLSLFEYTSPISVAESPTRCESISKEVSVISTTGGASTWSNLRNSEGSIRFETNRILGDALAKAPTAVAPQDVCPDNCRPRSFPKVVFLAVPRKVLSKYSDKEECAKLLDQTTANPLQYGSHRFDNASELANWFNDFSQGSGVDGKDLYNRCYGKCSPRYTTLIQQESKDMKTETKVICGHARDKSDDVFSLEIKYLWTCEDK